MEELRSKVRKISDKLAKVLELRNKTKLPVINCAEALNKAEGNVKLAFVFLSAHLLPLKARPLFYVVWESLETDLTYSMTYAGNSESALRQYIETLKFSEQEVTEFLKTWEIVREHEKWTLNYY